MALDYLIFHGAENFVIGTCSNLLPVYYREFVLSQSGTKSKEFELYCSQLTVSNRRYNDFIPSRISRGRYRIYCY